MKFTVLQENLKRALTIVTRATTGRSTLLILDNVLLRIENGRLRISGTNLEMGITCWTGIKVDEEGDITLPAQTLSDLIATLPTDHVHMTLEAATLTMKLLCGSSTAEVKGIKAADFPPMPVVELSDGIQINAGILKELIGQVAYAASTDLARPVMTGVYVMVADNQITMAAADGFRLAVCSAEIESAVGDAVTALIPAPALAELSRILNDDEAAVTMVLQNNRAIFRAGDIELYTATIDGTFPQYEEIIPKEHKTRTVIQTDMFLTACRQAEIFAREDSLMARITIDPGTPSVQITGRSDETGSNQSLVDAAIEGEGIEITFNVKFLTELLRLTKTPSVALETTVPTSPAVIRPFAGGDSQGVHVIMPMHTGN